MRSAYVRLKIQINIICETRRSRNRNRGDSVVPARKRQDETNDVQIEIEERKEEAVGSQTAYCRYSYPGTAAVCSVTTRLGFLSCPRSTGLELPAVCFFVFVAVLLSPASPSLSPSCTILSGALTSFHPPVSSPSTHLVLVLVLVLVVLLFLMLLLALLFAGGHML